jgi:hypothetical protein
LKRNLNGIGKTVYTLSENQPPVIVIERVARLTLERIENLDAQRRLIEPDLSGEHFGSIEGNVVEAITHYGRPALRVRENLSEELVLCVFSKDKSDDIGKSRSWAEVWAGQRVRIVGNIKRNKSGAITIVDADDLFEINVEPLSLMSIRDRNITNGRRAASYLAEGWGGELGEN